MLDVASIRTQQIRRGNAISRPTLQQRHAHPVVHTIEFGYNTLMLERSILADFSLRLVVPTIPNQQTYCTMYRVSPLVGERVTVALGVLAFQTLHGVHRQNSAV